MPYKAVLVAWLLSGLSTTQQKEAKTLLKASKEELRKMLLAEQAEKQCIVTTQIIKSVLKVPLPGDTDGEE
jgi:hypothetical protein